MPAGPAARPPAYLRNFAPVEAELDLAALPVTGGVPRGLAGTLVRNGPNTLQARPGQSWLDGDGMLHAFRFSGGRVSYRNRWLRTQRWRRWPPGDGRGDDGAGNTNVLAHAGRLIALSPTHPPLLVRGDDLRSVSALDPHGALAGAFTTHPKRDPATGELVFFGGGTPHRAGDDMTWGTFDAAGTLSRLERFVAPCAGTVHDFAITAGHVLLPVTPSPPGDEGGLRSPVHGSHVGILQRGAGAPSIRWHRAPLGHVLHTMNAYEEGDFVHLDVMQADLSVPPDALAGGSGPCLARWSFSLSNERAPFVHEWLCDMPGEFPRIDERCLGRCHRHGWFIGDGAHGEPFTRIVHVDHVDGRLDVHELPRDDCASEAVFVPRTARSREGDGWLLCVVFRGREERSDLLVLDAARVNAGPVAAVHLPVRVPNGLHGNWIGAAA